MKTLYRERDYEAGKAIQALRTKIGLTQCEKELASLTHNLFQLFQVTGLMIETCNKTSNGIDCA